MINYLQETFNSHELIVFFLSMAPIGELRFSIPYGIIIGNLSWPLTFILSYIGNLIISIILIFVPIIGWIFGFFVYWLYFAIQHSSSKQATLGMRALEIKITDEKHNKISFWRASGNYFVTTLSGMLLFIGFFMIAFTSRKQGLHNLISRTLCIKTK